MTEFMVVENPRKKRKSGKRKSRKRRTYRKRRNSTSLATYRNPTKRGSRRSTRRRKTYRGRSNPANIMGIDLTAAFFVAGGMIGTKTVPVLVRQYLWAGLPVFGFGGIAVKAGSVFALGFLVKMVTKSTARASQVMIGGVASILYDLYTEFLEPKIMGATMPTAGVGGFIDSPYNLHGFVDYDPYGNLGRYEEALSWETMSG